MPAQPSCSSIRIPALPASRCSGAGGHRRRGETRTSRWYVTSLFTTFLVIVLLAQAGPNEAVRGFDERVAETALGVAIAYVFGMLVPTIRERRGSRAPTTASERM